MNTSKTAREAAKARAGEFWLDANCKPIAAPTLQSAAIDAYMDKCEIMAKGGPEADAFRQRCMLTKVGRALLGAIERDIEE